MRRSPTSFTAALITKGDFDLSFAKPAQERARKLAADVLHAKKLGVQRLASAAGDVVDMLRASGAHFFVLRVVKNYLLATVIFDALFDSGENAAVAWHHYICAPCARCCQSARNFDPRSACNLDPSTACVFRCSRPELRSVAEQRRA